MFTTLAHFGSEITGQERDWVNREQAIDTLSSK